jgi:hypothetical protein
MRQLNYVSTRELAWFAVIWGAARFRGPVALDHEDVAVVEEVVPTTAVVDWEDAPTALVEPFTKLVITRPHA